MIAAPRSDSSAGSPRPLAAPNRETLAHWFTQHHDVVCRAVRRYGEDADTAADFAQQAFLVATERFTDIRTGSERAFLIATARQLSFTSRRKHARMHLEPDLEPLMSNRDDDDDEPAVRRAYARQLIERALSCLDEPLLDVFLLYEAEGSSRTQIARELGIPPGTVATRLRRARELYYASVAELEAPRRLSAP